MDDLSSKSRAGVSNSATLPATQTVQNIEFSQKMGNMQKKIHDLGIGICIYEWTNRH